MSHMGMNYIVWFIDIVFAVTAIFNIYWQSQIVVRAKYKYSSLFWGLLIGYWLAAGSKYSLDFILLISLFVLLSFMGGIGGIGEKRLVSSGFYSGTIEYKRIKHILLIPAQIANVSRDQVLAVFNMNSGQTYQMTFNYSANDIYKELKKHISEDTQIEIGKIQ